MNVGQAAEYLGVSAASLRNWSDQGKVPVYRTPGGQRRYRVTDLEKFIESWRETPVAKRPSRYSARRYSAYSLIRSLSSWT